MADARDHELTRRQELVELLTYRCHAATDKLRDLR
ncbi:hypothetical protein HaLaN_14560, partial [Haematococcus lacustris]